MTKPSTRLTVPDRLPGRRAERCFAQFRPGVTGPVLPCTLGDVPQPRPRPRPRSAAEPPSTAAPSPAAPSPAPGAPREPEPGGPFRVAIRVKPRARRDHCGGAWGADLALVVEVRAPAVDGRANAAVEAVVADAFGVPRRHVRLVAGDRSRTKLVEIDGPPPTLSERLVELLASR